MAAEKHGLITHSRPLTESEIDAFNMVHYAGKKLVMVPAVVNGQERFALAVMIREDDGNVYVHVLAIVAHPDDRIVTAGGEEISPIRPSEEKNLN